MESWRTVGTFDCPTCGKGGLRVEINQYGDQRSLHTCRCELEDEADTPDRRDQ